MKKKFSASMFEELASKMQESRGGNSFKDILKTEVGKTYLVRLVPNVDEVGKTSFHYFNHGWKSLATGSFVSSVCPTTYGERCPICEERVRLYRTGDSEDKESAKMLSRKENWLINCYVIEDPTNDKNIGSTKILRYGKQLDAIINEAMSGEDKDEFGMRIFDLSEDGCNFRIKVDRNEGGYPSYVKSKFLRESEIEGMTEKKIEEVYDGIFDLESVFDRKTPEEIKILMDTHFLCTSTTSLTANTDDDDDDEDPVEDLKKKTKKSKKTKEVAEKVDDDDDGVSDDDDDDDDATEKLRELMADL